jgi:Fe-S cluster biogenesis protein NfuA
MALSDSIYIRPTPTPNPNSVKFVVNFRFLEFGGRDFADKASAEGSPLAEKLWALPGVGGIFIGTDFVTVSEGPDCDWGVLGEGIINTLRAHIDSGEPHVKPLDVKPLNDAELGEIQHRVQAVLDASIRPAVAADGGDVSYVGFENGVVYLKMHGSCSGCPSSTATLRQGIEGQLRAAIPEIIGVSAVD